MRNVLQNALGLVFTLGLVTCYAQKQERPLLKSTVENITYVLNDTDRHPNWKISPDLKPDRLEIECKQKVMKVAFVTDTDSISFKVKQGDTIQFYVLQKGREKALTEIVGTPKNANFSKKYIRAHKGKSTVEIPEVHELANVLVALSKVGQQDSNMVDMTSPYYQEVMAHFTPYKNHPILEVVNRHITKPFEDNSYWYYYALKMNACAYVFDKKGAIKNEGIIRKMGFNNLADPIVANLALLEDFARKSNFRGFYRKNQPYYNILLKTHHTLNPLQQMQTWLETRFPTKYGSYRVTFSPLVGGAHSTQRFKDNGFQQTIMFVCRAEPTVHYNAKINEMLASRVVFTEIDHNFVNPLSDKYAGQIKEVFADRKKWAADINATSAYGSPYAVFNEYMTWAVFSLYCFDTFSTEDNATFLPIMERQMEKGRGFIKFSAFHQKLLALYKENPASSIDDLYTAMLAWSKTQ